MAIDVDSEDLHPFNQTAKWWPKTADREPPNFQSANRWRVTGLLRPDGSRVRIESVMLAGRRYTSTEAARRFIAALNAGDDICVDEEHAADIADTADTVATAGRNAAKALAGMGI